MDADITRCLAELQVDTVLNDKNLTPLHRAAGFGDIKAVSFLIESGANVNALDSEGQAPLHNASCHGHFTTAEKLIEAGALVDLADNQGWTPLTFAVARKHNLERIAPRFWQVIELLLNNGANPYSKSKSGRVCIKRIKCEEDRSNVRIAFVLNKLKNAQLDGNQRSDIINRYLKRDDFFELVKTGDDNLDLLKKLTTSRILRSHLASLDGITPLHRAAGYNQLETAKFFLSQGANPNLTDNFGRIALHNAAQYGHVKMIRLLVKERSDINKQDLIGFSPLHVAASNQTYFACEELLDLDADLNLKCQNQKLPYDLAETDDVKEVLKPKNLKSEKKLTPSTSTQQAVYIEVKKKPYDSQPIGSHCKSSSDELMLDSSSSKRLFDNPSHTIKKITLLESDWRYQKVKRKMLDTIMTHNTDSGGLYRNFEILAIDLILNEKVWVNYRHMCEKLEGDYGVGSKNERLLFHGSRYIEDIWTLGFDERYSQRNGMFGAGIYFAEHSSKSNQYTYGLDEGCQMHKDKSCYICERQMIYAQVALGRTLIAREAMPESAHAPPGFSSVCGMPGSTDNLNYPEWVIYTGLQAYPLFVIRYRITE